jgi:hypothetical protein
VCYEETICVPGRTGDQAERATDGEVGLGGSGEGQLGIGAIPVEGRPGLDQLQSEG